MAPLSQVFDSCEESIVEMDDTLNVLHAMPQAVSMLQFYFPFYKNTARLPDAIECWLQHELSGQHNSGISGIIPVTSSFVRCSRKLIVIAFINKKMRAVTISFKEDQNAYSRYRRFVDQLTRRQKEVFHLMADGIRDIHEIAGQLGISHRTAEEHRRLIHHKVKQGQTPVLY